MGRDHKECSCRPRPRLDLCAKLGVLVKSVFRDFDFCHHGVCSVEFKILFLCPWCSGQRLFEHSAAFGSGPLWFRGICIDERAGRMFWSD